MKLIKELNPGDKFIYNKAKYYLVSKDFHSSNNAYKFDLLNLTKGIKEVFINSVLQVELIKEEYLSPFDTVKDDLFSEHKKINDIAANSPDKKLKLYLGCFNKPIPHFVNVDVRPYPETLCDVVDDILKLEKFEDESVHEILSVHTLEHVGRYEYKDALKIWFSKLKKGGILWLSVPDIQACCEHYIYHHDLEFLLSFFVGSQKHKYDYHYMVFDYTILSKALTEVGFSNIELYDWTKTDFAYIDSYQGSYAKHLDRSSRLMSLNVKATKT